MLVGFDSEFRFDRVPGFFSRHIDASTFQPICACLVFEDGREMRFADKWHLLQAELDRPDYTFIVHGAHAESWFCHEAGLRFPTGHYVDTFLMGVMLAHASSFHPADGAYAEARLAGLAARYAPNVLLDEKQEIRDSILDGTYLKTFGMKRILDYCAADARAALGIYEPLADQLRRIGGPSAFRNLSELYQPYSLVMAESQRKGIRFDRGAWCRLLEAAPRYRSRLLKLMRVAGYNHDGPGLGPKALERMVTRVGLAQRWPRTPTGQFQTCRDALKQFRTSHPAINAAYLLQNFEGLIDLDLGLRVGRDGRIRCNILPLAQRTGRNSTTDPNLMGLPREFRPLLLPDEGCVFVHFDYEQQEPGVAGHLSNDQALLHDFSSGDIYTSLGRRLGLLRPTMTDQELRETRCDLLKPLVLSMLYGMRESGIARTLDCTTQEAALRRRLLEINYPTFFEWLRAYTLQSLQQGWAENVIGYRACFEISELLEQGHLARSCQNFPIQASAAACFQVTGLHLADLGADIRLPMHDAYVLNVPNDPVSIENAQTWISAATKAATTQLFPGLPVRCQTNVLSRFAKDGRVDSFDQWLASLEA